MKAKMKSFAIFLILFASAKLTISVKVTSTRKLNESSINLRSSRQAVILKPAGPNGQNVKDDINKDPEDPNAPKVIPLPQTNFYNSIPNGVGTISNGLLFLREMSATLGSPLPIFVGAIPMVIFGFILMFLPDLSSLGLPLFYPNGGPNDPLANFPPIPDIIFDDYLMDVSALKQGVRELMAHLPDFSLK